MTFPQNRLLITCNKLQDIYNLKPSTVLNVFHGTEVNDAYNFCVNGINSTELPKCRRLPHAGYKGPGIYVSPSLLTARKFGEVVLKFPIMAKNLQYPWHHINNTNPDQYKRKFPNSFDPALTYGLLDGIHKNSSTKFSFNTPHGEMEARFVGNVDPISIQVYVETLPFSDKYIKLSRQEFLDTFNADKKWRHGQIYEKTPFGLKAKRTIK